MTGAVIRRKSHVQRKKMLVLQMVADGQITPEQGVELLNALEPERPMGCHMGYPKGYQRGYLVGCLLKRTSETL